MMNMRVSGVRHGAWPGPPDWKGWLLPLDAKTLRGSLGSPSLSTCAAPGEGLTVVKIPIPWGEGSRMEGSATPGRFEAWPALCGRIHLFLLHLYRPHSGGEGWCWVQSASDWTRCRQAPPRSAACPHPPPRLLSHLLLPNPPPGPTHLIHS